MGCNNFTLIFADSLKTPVVALTSTLIYLCLRNLKSVTLTNQILGLASGLLINLPVHRTQLVYSPLQLIHDQAHEYHLLQSVTHQGQMPLQVLRFLHLADAVVVQNACSSSLQPAKIVKLLDCCK